VKASRRDRHALKELRRNRQAITTELADRNSMLAGLSFEASELRREKAELENQFAVQRDRVTVLERVPRWIRWLFGAG
jgi:hypothetical protein